MGFDFCIVQDLQTGKIIGRGIKKNGLYVDEVSQKGKASFVRGSVQQQLWIWPRQLGQPSLGTWSIFSLPYVVQN